MEENISYAENLFLKADTLITEGKITEGKELLEELLQQFPDYGRAHNHIGWIYCTKYSNYEKGEYHYKLAMKFTPKYPPSYLNYSYLLVDIGRYQEAKILIDLALNTVEGIDFASFYSELGKIHEMEGDYFKAYKYYKDARNKAMNPAFIDNMNAGLDRVKNKMSTFEKIKLRFK
ncbi:tetratricopeptide repeat protein [Flavobacterium sp. '19STA2R22 D10 B1']|uniref:tetratricopeptide repeat protein n=1 Tax=Flavobacterium aerium TaxID=3037261 RepID=UPI00278BD77C|nr:hypothetical protein [Flavobacterium sp. '19STA2R22 D10 B1']